MTKISNLHTIKISLILLAFAMPVNANPNQARVLASGPSPNDMDGDQKLPASFFYSQEVFKELNSFGKKDSFGTTSLKNSPKIKFQQGQSIFVLLKNGASEVKVKDIYRKCWLYKQEGAEGLEEYSEKCCEVRLKWSLMPSDFKQYSLYSTKAFKSYTPELTLTSKLPIHIVQALRDYVKSRVDSYRSILAAPNSVTSNSIWISGKANSSANTQTIKQFLTFPFETQVSMHYGKYLKHDDFEILVGTHAGIPNADDFILAFKNGKLLSIQPSRYCVRRPCFRSFQAIVDFGTPNAPELLIHEEFQAEKYGEFRSSLFSLADGKVSDYLGEEETSRPPWENKMCGNN